LSLLLGSVGFLLDLILTLNMELIPSSKMSGCLQTANSYNPEDCTLPPCLLSRYQKGQS
jgi:hypothetical protein